MQNSEGYSLRGRKTILSGVGMASIAQNAGYLISTRGLNIVVRLVYAMVLARFLGPELYGLLSYGISWYIAFLSFTGLGTASILSKEIGRNKNDGTRIVSITLTLRISLTVIAALACGLLSWFIESKPEVRILMLIFSVALIGRSLTVWTESVFNAYERNKYTFRLQAIFRISEVCLGIACLVGGGGLISVAIVHGVTWWLQAISGLALGTRRLVKMRLSWSWLDLRNLLLLSLPIGVAIMLGTWLQTGALIMFRHISNSINSLGQLALAMQVLMVMSSVPIAVSAASLPVLSRAVMRQDGKDLLFTQAMLKAAFIIGAIAGLAALGGGSWLINIIFGTRYSEAGRLLGLAMWLFIPLTCGITLNTEFVAKGKFTVLPVCTGAGVIALTLTMPWLIAVLDTSGAVISAGIGMWVWSLSLIWILARSGDMNVFQTIFRPSVVILVALGIFFTVQTINIWFALAASWAALFSGTLLFGVLTKDEWNLLLSLKRRRR